jgi:RNA polymerase sigma-70 factor (ECF subfamily)
MDPDASTLHPEELLAHADWVQALAVRLVHDRDVANDLVQETWLAALRRPPARGRSPRPWLARVLRNFAYARGHARWSRDWHHDERTRLDSAQLTPDELVGHVDAQRVVAEAVVRLAEPFRTTVLQRYYQGLSSAEIARRADLPPGTVRWRLKRGLDLMRAQLDDARGGRAAWSALLAPLCRFAPAPAAPGAAGILGDLGLSLAGRALAVVTLATGLTYGGWQLTRTEATDRPVHALEPRATGDHATGPARAVPGAPAGAEAPRRVAAPGPPDAPRVVGTPDDAAPVTVRARALDPSGAPLAHAVLDLAHAGAATSAAAGADGALTLTLPDVRRERSARVVVRADGFVCQVFAPRLAPGAELDLGSLTLAPAAVVTGVVRDALGRALADVEVVAVPAAQLAEALAPAGRPACAQAGRTDERGAFELPCVPHGAARVIAFPGGAEPIVSSVLDLTPAAPAPPLELRVEPVDQRRVTGRILAPDGTAARGARLAWRIAGQGAGRRDARWGQGDEAGTFALETPRAGQSIEFLAWSADGALVAGPLEARAGGAPVVLVLERAPRATLVVRSAAARAPLPAFDVEVRDIDWDLALFERRGHDGRLAVPLVGSELTVHARGFESATVAAPVGERLEVTLTPLGIVSGVVLDAHGAPVPRAQVALYRRKDEQGTFALHGLPLDRARHPSATGRTDRKGCFELVCPDAGRYVLRVERKGAVPFELDGLELAPGARGLTVAFGPGGAAAGELRLPDGSPGAGLWVAATRGDHAPRAARADANGRFRFDDLMPGPWAFVLTSGPLPTRASSITEHGHGFTRLAGPVAFAGACRVEPGGVAHVVLEPDGPAARRLRGRLRVTGGPALQWTAQRGAEGVPCALDAAGRFELEATGDGGDVLLSGAGASGARLELALPSGGDLELDLELGAVEGYVQALGVVAGGALAYEWEDADGRRARASVRVDARGHFRLAVAPAGVGRLVDEDGGRVLAEVEVPAGGSASIELR